MSKLFSRTRRRITFVLLLLLGLTFFGVLYLDLLNINNANSGAAAGVQGYVEDESANIEGYFQYRFDQMKDKSGKIPEGALIRALNDRKTMVARQKNSPVPSVAGIDNGNWTFAGPGNIGGRIRAVLPLSSSTVLIGSVSGGLWKTTNCCSSSTTWAPIDDFMANLAISSLIVDPTNANVLYASTGEGFNNIDAVRGAGMFKSTDGGTTWSQLPSTSNIHFVSRLAISPDGATLLAASNAGIRQSTDAGATWTLRMSGTFRDVRFDPSNSNNAVGGADGLPAYSTDGGTTWTAATGLPTSGRLEVAYAPSNPSIVYIARANAAIYKSTDGGQTYAQVNADAGHQSGQGWFNNAIWVNPADENHLVVGGLDMYQSTDGGVTFSKISNWVHTHPSSTTPPSPHADHHALVSLPGSSTALLNGNDGGMYYTADILTAGNNPPTHNNGWVEMNTNLGITQFYGVAGNSAGLLYGGTQDNGTIGGNEAGVNAWDHAKGGDGGASAADPTDPNYLYNEFTFARVHRSSNGGIGTVDLYGIYNTGSGWVCRAAPYRIDDACNTTGPFIAPILLDPNNPERLLVGSRSLWVTNEARKPVTSAQPIGLEWTAIKPFAGSNVSAIAVAPGNSDIIWVGQGNSEVYLTSNGTDAVPTWTQVDTNIGVDHPGTGVGRIAIDQNDNNIVYVGFKGFGPNRVWRTADGGATWSNITSNLPQAPIYAVAINPANSAWLYVGTEIGLFASDDAGATWNVPGTGMNGDGPANVAVFDLQWVNGGNSTGTNVLIAGTHGRGAWTADTAACTAPTAVSDLVANENINGTDVDLNWTATDADVYEIQRTINDPYFMSGGTLVTTIAGTSYTDAGKLGDPTQNHFYNVVAKKNCGATAVASNHVGEFDFNIEPGTP